MKSYKGYFLEKYIMLHIENTSPISFASQKRGNTQSELVMCLYPLTNFITMITG